MELNERTDQNITEDQPNQPISGQQILEKQNEEDFEIASIKVEKVEIGGSQDTDFEIDTIAVEEIEEIPQYQQ